MTGRQRMPRRAVRLPIRFWRRGKAEETYVGYSTNVSDGGLFVATRKPLPPGARIEVEVEESGRSVQLDAEVIHAARFPSQFAQILKSGMGIRFRQPEDPDARRVAGLGVSLSDHGGRRTDPRPPNG